MAQLLLAALGGVRFFKDRLTSKAYKALCFFLFFSLLPAFAFVEANKAFFFERVDGISLGFVFAQYGQEAPLTFLFVAAASLLLAGLEPDKRDLWRLFAFPLFAIGLEPGLLALYLLLSEPLKNRKSRSVFFIVSALAMTTTAPAFFSVIEPSHLAGISLVLGLLYFSIRLMLEENSLSLEALLETLFSIAIMFRSLSVLTENQTAAAILGAGVLAFVTASFSKGQIKKSVLGVSAFLFLCFLFDQRTPLAPTFISAVVVGFLSFSSAAFEKFKLNSNEYSYFPFVALASGFFSSLVLLLGFAKNVHFALFWGFLALCLPLVGKGKKFFLRVSATASWEAGAFALIVTLGLFGLFIITGNFVL